MARPGQAISNPITGEHVVFRRTGDDRLELDLALRPGGVIAGVPHRHPQSERFRVTAGRLAGWIAGEGPVSATAGEEVVVPAWRDHWLANGGIATTRAEVMIRPAGDMASLMEISFALASGRRPPGLGRLGGALEVLRLVRKQPVVPSALPRRLHDALLAVPAGLAPGR
jgi:mannose-6-phosphate isomerase-like protein (cupin superfamily)